MDCPTCGNARKYWNGLLQEWLSCVDCSEAEKPCQHMNFAADVKVGRLTQVEGGPITGYTADVTVKCAECGLPFRFVGLAAGNHYAEPRVSADGTELRAPIEPATHEKFATHLSYAPQPHGRH